MRLSLVISLGATTFDAVAMQDGWTALDRLAALGYDGVEVAVRDPGAVDGGRLRDHCVRLGLPVAALGTGQAFLEDGLSLTSPEAGIRRAASERLRQHINLASILNAVPGAPPTGVQVIVGLIRGRAAAGRAQAEEWLRKFIKDPAVSSQEERGGFSAEEGRGRANAPGFTPMVGGRIR